MMSRQTNRGLADQAIHPPSEAERTYPSNAFGLNAFGLNALGLNALGRKPGRERLIAPDRAGRAPSSL